MLLVVERLRCEVGRQTGAALKDQPRSSSILAAATAAAARVCNRFFRVVSGVAVRVSPALPSQPEAERIDWLAGGQLIAPFNPTLSSLLWIGVSRQIFFLKAAPGDLDSFLLPHHPFGTHLPLSVRATERKLVQYSFESGLVLHDVLSSFSFTPRTKPSWLCELAPPCCPLKG